MNMTAFEDFLLRLSYLPVLRSNLSVNRIMSIVDLSHAYTTPLYVRAPPLQARSESAASGRSAGRHAQVGTHRGEWCRYVPRHR